MIVTVTSDSGLRTLHQISEIRRELASQEFTWIDIQDPPHDGDVSGHLAELLGLDAARFDWLGRPDAPPRYVVDRERGEFVVPLVHDAKIKSVNVLVTPGYLLTVHRGVGTAFDGLRAGMVARSIERGATAMFLFSESAILTFRETLLAVRDEMDDLEEAIFTRPSRDRVVEMAAIRRRLIRFRRALLPYTEAVAAFEGQMPSRDDMPNDWKVLVSAHAQRVAAAEQAIDVVQQSASHIMDSYNSLIATRQGQVVNRLTIVALIFLPLTYLTGFFGMNFAYLQRHLQPSGAFWGLGIGLQTLSLAVVLIVVWRQGWLRLFRGDDD